MPEVRATGRQLVGTAVPYNKAADIAGMFRETVMPGCFAASMKTNDIRALADHRTDQLLGRTKSQTLQLIETNSGLTFAIDLPRTGLGDDLLELARRGDLSGCSIGFIATEERWPDPRTRVLHAADLREISIITGGEPAYPDTSVAVRHRDRATGAYLRRLRLLEAPPWAG